MVSRRYLRTKTMQAIFASELNDQEDLVGGEKKLVQSVESCYTLFLYFISLFSEIKSYRLNKQEDVKGKMFPTYEDLHPNTKFTDNLIISQIEDNKQLQILWKEHKISWTNEKDFIVQMFHEIESSETYGLYMAREERSYHEDKQFILDIIEKVFVNSELLHWYFEEKNLHWFDDYNEALLMTYKNIAAFKEYKGDQCEISPLYKDDEDRDFYKALYRQTMIHHQEYTELIDSKLQNWEAERVMTLDRILMEMALCEFLEFPEIPIKVTINEYIELAKNYSSAKSGLFINGILDKLVIDLKQADRLHKTGRGIINN